MSEKYQFTCYLIGEDNLLIQCAEMWLNKGHCILGVVSTLPGIKSWAFKNQIPYFDSLKAVEVMMTESKFDYLFSIINPHLIPASLLKQPRQIAINYHDSLLPRYAGVHATSWALLNNEKIHGVTWHVMTERMDEGDILKQAEINIEDHETALSLNLKCYQLAMTTFAELVDELDAKKIQRKTQDFTQCNYYSLNQKPPGNGWINWNSSAEDIDRLYRALSLGQYTNRLSLPKFMLGEQIFVIDRLQILKSYQQASPGTILELSSDKWRVATMTQEISLLQISSLEGYPCPLVDMAKRYCLKIGSRLAIPEISSYEKLEKLSTEYFKHEIFWVKALSQFKPAAFPFLPLNYSDSNKKINYHQLHTFVFSESLYQQLGSYFVSKAPLPVILLSTWLIYFYRLGNQNNLGISLNSDQLPKDMVMFISSLVPFFVHFHDEMCFEEVLNIVEHRYRQIKSHCTYLRDIVKRYPEIASHGGILPIGILILDKYQIEFVEYKPNAAMVVVISSDGKNMSLYADSELLNVEHNVLAALNNIPGHFDTLLNAIVKNKSQIISKLPILTSKERQQILIDWNQTATDYPKNKTISELFKEQVKKTPDNIAVSYMSYSLTYQELDKISDHFACYLESQGLKVGERVVISADQNVYLIVGLLAILKSSATYVPIDLGCLSQQIGFILDDIKPGIILTNNKYQTIIQNNMPSDSQQMKIILLEECLEIANKGKREKKAICHQPVTAVKIPAYIMYTSGTTGKPKGVIIGHKAIVRLVKNTHYIEIKSHDHIAQAANISFDAATLEIWGALLNGAHLVCAPKSILLDVMQFNKFLQQESITILWLTSVLFNQYASACVSMFKGLTYLLVGGDVLNPERIKTLFMCPQGTPRYILNGYGPTENTTFSSVYLISKEASERLSIPIGKPIANTTAYVLDQHLEPTLIGVAGELYVGGDGLADGYLHRPELTQKKFVINPFSTNRKSKLYKTGDMVCWLPDGNLEYLGRQDNQIKIRGFRIELEAVQSYLLQHDSINQCVVLRYESSSHTKFLVAYLIPKEGVNINIADIRNFMEQKLPFYMVPSFYILLEKFPLNVNGKIDIQLLPAPDLSQRNLKTAYTVPKTLMEKQLVAVWSDILMNPNIGVNDSFFDLGGHSLLLTKLILLMENKFNFKLTLYDFLEEPTVAKLAKLISKKKKHKATNKFTEILMNDSHLDESIKSDGIIDVVIHPKAILLTGATGFLGAHLLHDLYHLTQCKIYCLVRGQTEREAKNRLEHTLAKYCLPIVFDNRIVPVVGDLAESHLGLSSRGFSMLAEEVDAIYHNGAYVHHLYNYNTLKATNVMGTIELLKLASTHKLKQIHYLSTLSAVSEYLDKNHSIVEDFLPAEFNSSLILDGYSQTKLVAERFLSEANRRKIPVKIYRPGWILGQSETGIVSAENSHLLLLLKGCVQLGYAPEWSARLNILPVNFTSQFIVKTSIHHKIKNKVFNMVNPYSISWLDLIRYMKKSGYAINIIPSHIWKKEYLPTVDKNNAIFNLLPLYMNLNNLDWINEMDVVCYCNDDNTRNALEKTNLQYPKINENLLDIYIKYLQNQGFF